MAPFRVGIGKIRHESNTFVRAGTTRRHFDAKIVVAKSGISYKVTYGHVAKAIVDADMEWEAGG